MGKTRTGVDFGGNVHYVKKAKPRRVKTRWGVDLPAKIFDKDHKDGHKDGKVIDKYDRTAQCMVCGCYLFNRFYRPKKGSDEAYWYNQPSLYDGHLCRGDNLVVLWRLYRARANWKRVASKVKALAGVVAYWKQFKQ